MQQELHQLIVGDIREINPLVVIINRDTAYPGVDITYIASERTFGEVTYEIGERSKGHDISLDLTVKSDTVAIIRVRVYDHASFNIEQLEGLT